jgi:hypothetical protein
MNNVKHDDLQGDGLNLSSYYFLFFAVFVLFSILKMPVAMIDGRVWAEEGTVFFKDLFTRSIIGAIVYEYKGTVQVLTAMPVWIATRAPLSTVPYILTYFGFSVLCIVFFQLYAWARSIRLASINFLVLLVAWMFIPETYEVWASTVNVQWICSLSILLILLTDRESLSSNILMWSFWVLLCGLTGVPSCMLAPIFIVRAILDRSKPHAFLGLILSLCSIVQLIFILRSGLPERHFSFSLVDILVAPFLQTILVPSFGAKSVFLVMTSIFDVREDYAGWRSISFTFLLFIFFLYLFVRSKKYLSDKAIAATAYVVSSWLLVSFLNVVGSLGGNLLLPYGSGRYFFFGASCFCLLLGLALAAKSKIVRTVAMIWLTLVAMVGVSQRFFATWPAVYMSGPSWQNQIQSCPPNQPCLIKVWPGGPGVSWQFVLSPRTPSPG